MSSYIKVGQSLWNTLYRVTNSDVTKQEKERTHTTHLKEIPTSMYELFDQLEKLKQHEVYRSLANQEVVAKFKPLRLVKQQRHAA